MHVESVPHVRRPGCITFWVTLLLNELKLIAEIGRLTDLPFFFFTELATRAEPSGTSDKKAALQLMLVRW